MIRLVPVPFERREELHALLADYLFEFDGRSDPYPYFDAYWDEPERLPFFIVATDAVVGFVLIRVRDGVWSIAEFSVVPDARRGGVGRLAVDALATEASAAGAAHLEAKVHPDNGDALLFWTAIGFRQVSTSGVVVTRREL